MNTIITDYDITFSQDESWDKSIEFSSKDGEIAISVTSKSPQNVVMSLSREQSLILRDFLVEYHKPTLFVTYDKVFIKNPSSRIIIVHKDLEKVYALANQCHKEINDGAARFFFHESNADRYIMERMKLFSLKDIKSNPYYVLDEHNKALNKLAEIRYNKLKQ